jgi:hypothetical protein
MATTKQDTPEQQPERPREQRIIHPSDGDHLSSRMMNACGDYPDPPIGRVEAEVVDYNGVTVASSSGLPFTGGGLKAAARTPPPPGSTTGIWSVQFTDLVPTPNPLQPYRLIAHEMEANGTDHRYSVRIILEAGHAIVPATCLPAPPSPGTESPEGT